MKNIILPVFLFLSVFTKSSIAQNNWELTNGPNGIDAIEVILTSDGRLVVSAANSGIYFSTDQGESWQKIFKGLPYPNSSTKNPGNLTEGENGIIYAFIDKYIYSLEKNSNEWIKTPKAFNESARIQATRNGYVYVIDNYTGPRLYYSSNKSQTFKSIILNSSIESIGAISFNGNGNNYLGLGESGLYNLYTMSDEGVVFQKFYSTDIFPFQFFRHSNGYLFGYSPLDGLIRFDSLGKNPKKIVIDGNTGLLTMGFKPNGNIVAANYQGDYESSNNGNNWIKRNSEIYKRSQYATGLFFIDNNIIVHNTSCDIIELEKSVDDGITWIDFEKSFSNQYVKRMFISQSGLLFIEACYGNKYFYSSDKGVSWNSLNYDGSRDITMMASGKLYGISNNDISVSSNLGIDWNHYILGLGTYNERMWSDYKNKMYIRRSPFNTISVDGGENWTMSSSNGSEYYFNPNGTLYYYSAGQPIKIYYSIDTGKIWIDCNSQFVAIYDIAFSANGSMYISGALSGATKPGLYFTNDNLQTIIELAAGEIHPIFIDASENIYGFNSASTCLRSIDGGLNWNPFNSGLPENGKVISFAMDPDQYLYLAYQNDVIYKSIKPISEIDATEEEVSDADISIHPNPVENKMTITITNKNISSGYYKIIDLNGTETVKGDFQSNSFSVDCSMLTNGMAFIQIFGNGNSHYTEKIVIAH